ncbi:MAG: hypothetical protein ACKVS8_04010 [Phycisphaerales bacterium]
MRGGNVAVGNLPPLGLEYEGQFHSWGGGQVTLTDPVHSGFTASFAPPALGMSQVHNFGSTVAGMVSAFGSPPMPVSVPGVPVAVRVDHVSDSGATMFFDTEMLQLDINFGGGVMVRESLTLQSLGKTEITDIGGGMFFIDSFFDVFTELSLDGGQTWIPSDGSVEMVLHPTPGAAGLLALGGLAAARRRRN